MVGMRGPVHGHRALEPERQDHGYRTSCDCGWVGDWQRRKHDADDDLIDHLMPFRRAQRWAEEQAKVTRANARAAEAAAVAARAAAKVQRVETAR